MWIPVDTKDGKPIPFMGWPDPLQSLLVLVSVALRSQSRGYNWLHSYHRITVEVQSWYMTRTDVLFPRVLLMLVFSRPEIHQRTALGMQDGKAILYMGVPGSVSCAGFLFLYR